MNYRQTAPWRSRFRRSLCPCSCRRRRPACAGNARRGVGDGRSRSKSASGARKRERGIGGSQSAGGGRGGSRTQSSTTAFPPQAPLQSGTVPLKQKPSQPRSAVPQHTPRESREWRPPHTCREGGRGERGGRLARECATGVRGHVRRRLGGVCLHRCPPGAGERGLSDGTHPRAVRALPAEADSVASFIFVRPFAHAAIVDDCGGRGRIEWRRGCCSEVGASKAGVHVPAARRAEERRWASGSGEGGAGRDGRVCLCSHLAHLLFPRASLCSRAAAPAPGRRGSLASAEERGRSMEQNGR